MDKPVIAVDFDDVVMNFNFGFMNFHNLRYGTNLTYDRLINYDNWEVVYGSDAKTMVERALEFYHSDEHQLVEPVVGAIEAIKELSKDYSLQIVTSRPERVRGHTTSWLERHFPTLFHDYHFTNIYAATAGSKPIKKAEVCHSIGARALIDDALRHAREVSLAGIPVLLPDRPWNQTETLPNIHRMHSWDDIVNWIRANV